MENTTKVCKKCGEEKDLDEFYKHRKSYTTNCKRCETERTKKYISENREFVLAKRKERYYKNQEINLAKKKKYDNDNRELIRKRARESYDPEKAKKYYKENKEEILKRNKRWSDENKDRHRKINCENTKNWLKENPHVVVWRQMVYRLIKKFNKKKESSTSEILGYSALDLKLHIQNQFVEGMSWENWGKWHIDHIKPIFTFDVNTPISEVNALENLRPIWAEENLKRKRTSTYTT